MKIQSNIKVTLFVIWLIAAMSFVSCGKKGPLVRPDIDAQVSTPSVIDVLIQSQ